MSSVCAAPRSRLRNVESVSVIAARAVAGEPALGEARAYSPPDIGCSVTPYLDPFAARQVREEGEYYIPDFLSDKDREADPEFFAAADDETEGLRQAMAYLDEAVNLVAVLMASMEEDADARAMQAETVLKIVEKKLNKAHTRIDRQERRYRNLFLAYFELQERSENDAE
jgi:hypothetical protein